MLKLLEMAGFVIYIGSLLFIGGYIARKNVGNKSHVVYGYLAFILAMADSIYFIPRMYSLMNDGIESNLKVMGFGRIGHMIVITLFYMVFTDFVKARFNVRKKLPIEKLMYGLMIFRIVIGIFPQNKWFDLTPDPIFAYIRFIPLVLFVLLLSMTLLAHGTKRSDTSSVSLAIFLLLQLFFVEYPIWKIDSVWITYLMAAIRGLIFIVILSAGYTEVRRDTELSRF
ncbi:MAG: hypothetical protein RBT15_01695 [Gudongella sp.]|jgi:hypothetical protein|nr:hypothetical protein [Gudongella sp.]